MASGASSTLTKELRIELKFVTTQFLNQTRTAARALDILNSRLGKTQASANETQDAFRQLAKETRAVGSKENTVTFQQNAKALREVSRSAKGAKTSLNQYSTAATRASSKSNKISSGFGGVGKASTRAKNAVQGLTTALGGFITIQSARSALNNALAFDRVENRMRAATNSTEEYNKKTKFASELADKLGVDLLAASRGFATLTAATRGSGVEGAVTDQLFESILKTSAALSLTADETNSVILAFGQVASKGRAAAEEIRGQIGERIPGFYTKLAEALGITQGELTKLLDQGLLSSDQALKASAIALEKAFGQKALDNAQSATAQYNRIVNEVRQAGNESARWLANNSAIILSIRKIGELLAANRIVRESDSDLVNNSIEITEKRIAQLEILRRQGEITNKEARAGILKAINDQEVALRGVEKTKDQLEELERVRSFINDGTFDAIEAESNLLDITSEYLKNEREVTKERLAQEKIQKDQIALQELYNKGAELPIFDEYNKSVKEQEKSAKNFLDLQFEAQLAVAQALKTGLEQNIAREKQIEQDKTRLGVLKEQLENLKEQEKALKGGTGKVNFIEAIQAGSAASVKVGIEARSRALGGVDSNKELLQENLEQQKETNRQLEELNNKIKVENA
jgi:tape measure domain-containing protein